jgi:hypothetical protein
MQQRPSVKNGRIILGMLVGTGVGGILCGLVCLLISRENNAGQTVAVPSLFLIPICIGLVAAWIWSPLELSLGRTLMHSASCFALALGVAALIFREGLICVIILSPILACGIVAGTLLGRIWFRRDRTRVNLWLAPLLAGVVLAEPATRGPHHSVVTDELTIAAPPARVWPHVLAFAPIQETPGYWLFRLGLPYPSETTNGGDFVGADRSCRFSGSAVFRERIVEFDPQRRLTFDILESPPDPELLGHLDAQRGQFELRANADGTTTLVGRTWYALHVRPAFYFDWWTHAIFSEVHLRVMRNVKRLAEADAASAAQVARAAEGLP